MPMWCRLLSALFTLPAVIRAIAMGGALTVLAGSVHAEITFNAGARISHDNNVNGSPDKPTRANQRDDNYLSLNASAVYYTPLDAAQTSYFIGQAGAMSSAYSAFSNLNNSGLVMTAGLYQQFSPTWSGQVTGRGFTRNTRQTERDSDGYGGTLELKKQLSQTVWVKAVADYEDSNANRRTFSYTGNTWGVILGYLPLQDTFVSLGYSHNKRDFKSTAPFNSTSKTLFVEVSQRLANKWFLNGGYAYGDNTSNYAGTAYTNHVVSAGVSFSY